MTRPPVQLGLAPPMVGLQLTPDRVEILVWLGVLTAGAVAISLLGLWIHRRLKAEDDQPDTAPPFTLASLRDMHRAGQLTDQEYEHARARMLAAVMHDPAGEADDDDDDDDEQWVEIPLDNVPDAPGEEEEKPRPPDAAPPETGDEPPTDSDNGGGASDNGPAR